MRMRIRDRMPSRRTKRTRLPRYYCISDLEVVPICTGSQKLGRQSVPLVEKGDGLFKA